MALPPAPDAAERRPRGAKRRKCRARASSTPLLRAENAPASPAWAGAFSRAGRPEMLARGAKRRKCRARASSTPLLRAENAPASPAWAGAFSRAGRPEMLARVHDETRRFPCGIRTLAHGARAHRAPGPQNVRAVIAVCHSGRRSEHLAQRAQNAVQKLGNVTRGCNYV